MGSNSNGQLGIEGITESLIPIQITKLNMDSIPIPTPTLTPTPTPTPTPEEKISDLITIIDNLNLPGGSANSLTSSLDNTSKFLENGDIDKAIDKLDQYINKVNNMIGSKLTAEEAEILINSAEKIKLDLIQ